MNTHYLSDEEFFAIYNKVPRLNVDLLIRSDKGILLSLRTIEPNPDCWHLPGGTVYKGERIIDAATRIAKKETGLNIKTEKCLGYMEFPHEIRSGIEMHTISIVMEGSPIDGELRHDENAKELRYFGRLPEKMIPEHGKFLRNLLD